MTHHDVGLVGTQVEWDQLVANRDAAVTRRQWRLLLQKLNDTKSRRYMTFSEQVEALAEAFLPGDV
eukprot:2552757-Pyramimonas_sp.AAC.1